MLVTSCQLATILVCVVAATAWAESPGAGREKRSEVSEGLLATLTGVHKTGTTDTRKRSENTRSVSNCGLSSRTGSHGSHRSWRIGGDSDWAIPVSRDDIMRSSAANSATTYCYHALVLLQLLFVLVSMA
ncbi:hypothetical protein RRG08_044575 [Elysia crispata]|uniref:Secreted protein n=1 Tax=Elysia crispata TaxID=231223 RepID=A0AAE0ZTQ9_9GAST|nr:hypothetical protein RRG08_044575 [Elysia crispata]